MKKPFLVFILSSVFCLLFSVFSCRPDLKIPKPSSGDADFTKFVALGGNFMAGYQDGALYKDGQRYSIPYLIAKFMHLAGGPETFAQPFMPDNTGLGINPKQWESEYQHASNLRYKLDCQNVNSLKPLKELFSVASASAYLQHQSGTFQNVSVPFATISQYDNASLGISSSNPFYNRFAVNAGISTALSDAKAQNPTFFSLWTGMEDIYDYARNGGYNQTILSSTLFGNYLDTICSQIGAKGVIANIPDISSFPFYTLVPWNGLELTKSQADSLSNLVLQCPTFFQEGKNGFMIEVPNTNTVCPAVGNNRKIVNGEYILLTVPLDSMKCNGLGSVTASLLDRYVLTSDEINTINQAVKDYNTVIAAKAQQYNLALVDMNSYFKKVVDGIKWNGVDLNAAFVSGGFFSLDGYHPNQKGYALLANEFVKAINSKYNSTIPTVNCPECSGIKFP